MALEFGRDRIPPPDASATSPLGLYLPTKIALRIQVFKKHQDPSSEAPAHTAPAWLAAKICAVIAVKILSERAIQLNTTESYASIKDRFRPTQDKLTKLAIREWRECLLLTYPHKDQSSFA